MVLDSIDSILTSAAVNGMFNRLLYFRHIQITPTNPFSQSNKGYHSIVRQPDAFTMPSVGTGLSGMYATACNLASPDGSAEAVVVGLEYKLGSLDVATNTFSSAGSTTMPTKTIKGTSIQTATLLPIVYVAASTFNSLGSTLSITYTDQDGNTGQTASVGMPANPVQYSGFLFAQNLASGDTGVRAVTNMSMTGTLGTLEVWGMLPLALHAVSGATPIGRFGQLQPLAQTLPDFLIEPGDKINVWHFDPSGSTGLVLLDLAGVAA